MMTISGGMSSENSTGLHKDLDAREYHQDKGKLNEVFHKFVPNLFHIRS